MRGIRTAWVLFGVFLAGAGCSSPSRQTETTGATKGSLPWSGENTAVLTEQARVVATKGYIVLLSTQAPTRKDPVKASLRDAVTHAESRAVAWRWRVNGETLPVTEQVLPVWRFRRGDEVWAEASTGEGGRTLIVSQRVRVMNAPPVVTAVAIDPMAPKKGDTITATAAVSDLDEDPVHVLYKWKVNEKLVQEGERNDFSLAGAKKGDQVHCEAVPDDGISTGGWAASPIVEVANSPPRILSLPPATAASGGPFTYTLRAEDPDGDPMIFEIVSGPPGIVLEGVTVRWAPAAGVSGPQHVVLRVTDNAGGEARQEFTLTLSE
jgi:hypothetical protein